MANEKNLRDRWNQVFHDSAEYQNALKSDALARFEREAQARNALSKINVFTPGGSAKAAAIQRQLMADGSAEITGQSGRAAALDAYQNQRVGDYIEQAIGRSGAELNDYAMGHSGPASVARGSRYTANLVDPDFSRQYPYMTIKPGSGPTRMRGRPPSGGGPAETGDAVQDPTRPSAEMITANTPTPAMIRELQRQGELRGIARERRVQGLRTTLPKDLLEVFESSLDRTKSPNSMSPKEQAAFFDASPEVQYSQLRSRQALASKTPKPSAGPAYTGSDYLSSAEGGFGGSTDLPNISRPVTAARPSAVLAAPVTDALDGTTEGGYIFSPAKPKAQYRVSEEVY